MRRTILLLTAAAAVVATMMATTSLAVAQGKGPKLTEGVLQLINEKKGKQACDPGEGETSGTTPSTNPAEPDFGAVHGGGFGFSSCYVTLPPQVLPIEEDPEF